MNRRKLVTVGSWRFEEEEIEETHDYSSYHIGHAEHGCIITVRASRELAVEVVSLLNENIPDYIQDADKEIVTV